MSGGGHHDSPLRAWALALALLAITLDFLQPLVHAAALRDGAPRSLWSALCYSTAADADGSSHGRGAGQPAASVDHDCCLGLAHAQFAAAAPQAFVRLPPVSTPAERPRFLDHSVNLGIRDGPQQPRAPPSSFA
jgi:hypothetical protein